MRLARTREMLRSPLGIHRLGLLLALSTEYSAHGGRLVLVTNEAVDSILDLTRLSSIFSCARSMDEASTILGETPT